MMESLRGIMKNESTSNSKGDYVLATGNAAANRLRILHNVYGPGAYELLIRAGIQPGMRVADFGCGTGMVTQLLAELVGPAGEVIGIDFSGDQLEQARVSLPKVSPMFLSSRQAPLTPGYPGRRLIWSTLDSYLSI